MIELEQLQILAQLVDNMEISSEKLEESYSHNNGEAFTKSVREILDIQKKISGIVK